MIPSTTCFLVPSFLLSFFRSLSLSLTGEKSQLSLFKMILFFLSFYLSITIVIPLMESGVSFNGITGRPIISYVKYRSDDDFRTHSRTHSALCKYGIFLLAAGVFPLSFSFFLSLSLSFFLSLSLSFFLSFLFLSLSFFLCGASEQAATVHVGVKTRREKKKREKNRKKERKKS